MSDTFPLLELNQDEIKTFISRKTLLKVGAAVAVATGAAALYKQIYKHKKDEDDNDYYDDFDDFDDVNIYNMPYYKPGISDKLKPFDGTFQSFNDVNDICDLNLPQNVNIVYNTDYTRASQKTVEFKETLKSKCSVSELIEVNTLPVNQNLKTLFVIYGNYPTYIEFMLNILKVRKDIVTFFVILWPDNFTKEKILLEHIDNLNKLKNLSSIKDKKFYIFSNIVK